MQPPHNLQRQATLWSNRPAPSKQQRQAHCSQTKTPIPTPQPTKTGNTVKQSQQPTGPGILWSNWPSNLQGLAYCGQSLKKYPATYKNWHTVVKPTQQVTRTAHCGQTDPAAYNRHAGKMGRYKKKKKWEDTYQVVGWVHDGWAHIVIRKAERQCCGIMS